MSATSNRSRRLGDIVGRSQEHVANIFRLMDALRQSLPKSKGKTVLKELVKLGRRF